MSKYCRNLFLVVRFIHKRVNMIKLYFGPHAHKQEESYLTLTGFALTPSRYTWRHTERDNGLPTNTNWWTASSSLLRLHLIANQPMFQPHHRCWLSRILAGIMSVDLVVSQLVSLVWMHNIYGLSSGRHRMIPCSHRTLSHFDSIHFIPRVPEPWNHHHRHWLVPFQSSQLETYRI